MITDFEVLRAERIDSLDMEVAERLIRELAALYGVPPEDVAEIAADLGSDGTVEQLRQAIFEDGRGFGNLTTQSARPLGRKFEDRPWRPDGDGAPPDDSAPFRGE